MPTWLLVTSAGRKEHSQIKKLALTLELIWEWLLHIACVLIVRILAELHGLLVTSVPLLHSNLGRDHVLGRAFDVRARLGPSAKLAVVDCLLVSQVVVHQVHLSHALDDVGDWPDLIDRHVVIDGTVRVVV